ncbi:zinc finger protein 469-like [Megalops cyprinoides]|uniref:zinc finger protein 469-like n=1 Tax=Megalops cyprinoides TaxID=118141 RepID=UPI001864FD88|nr:zinc finger protein 469-like [Megalops cyprinoides]
MGSTAKDTPANHGRIMTGETKHAHAVKESDSGSKDQDEGSLSARFSVKVKQESEGHYKCGGLESRPISRAKEYTQREAVIRPQQAGKIDFKSLQNRPKFSNDRTWPSGKGSPQSPSGKSRARDRSKKSGKADRSNPQQLYMLSISKPRSKPTIGIAYPQQKVTPPKKLETSPGPISGSYRFHVPSIPEREAELQQEELNYNRCFQEASSNLTTTNYTSQAESAAGATPVHQHPIPPQQQPGPRENNSSQPSEGQGDAQTDSQFNNKQPEGRSPYTQLPQPAQYLQSPHETQSSMHCHKSRSKHSANRAFDWHDSKKPHKNGPLNSCHNKRPSEAFTNLRQESIKESCTNTSGFSFDNRVEAVSSPVCETRSKPVYFGVSQSLAGPPSKTNSHDSSQVPPVGLMAAAPYESPLPSPIQNPASTSPCSSLSPPSHSPVNISPEDSQVAISGPPPPLYHQHQGKTLMPTDHLNSNLHHFHTDLSRTFPNSTERAKEDMMGYIHNNKGSRPSTDSGKTCMNSFGVEHPPLPPPPPPPYSAHQLLASSLAAANLDQLDVLLTCKQCDQNFNNLASFLDHKQYCGQHMSTQNNIYKSVPKMEDTRKFQTDSLKGPSSGMSFPLSRCPSDMHLSLLGLSKNGELMSDIETKVDPKDESLKPNLFPGTNTLPGTLPDLEMDDAKLDSLITEALNGLGYQSDNAEIDSSFIDAFVDDDLTTSQNLKSKDSMMFNSRGKHEASTDERSQTQGKHLYDSDRESESTESKNTANIPEKTLQDFKQKERANLKETTLHKKSRGLASEKSSEQNECVKEEKKSTDKIGEKSRRDSRLLLSKKFSERCKIKSFQEQSSLLKPSLPQTSPTNWSTAASRVTAREGKRRKTGGGTWSKELIHKIVQQKNKPHNPQVKGAKSLQPPLASERLTPVAQSPKFGEYDYVSDSDEESEPLRLASRGRLGHAGRCKYTYSKEFKGREKTDNEGSVSWTPQSKERGVVKVAEDISPSPVKDISAQRVRRRSSRSSSSSELSEPASISSESITSPKTTDRTDSDSEKGLAVRKTTSNSLPLSDSFHQDTYKRSQVKTLKEPATTTMPTLPITPLSQAFSRNTKRYGTARFLLSTEKGPSSASKILNSSERNTESATIFPKAIQVRDLMEDDIVGQSSQEKREQCSSTAGMIERAEQPLQVKKSDRINYGSFKGSPADFQTTGNHCRLLVAEVTPDTKITDCKKINKNIKSEIVQREKSREIPAIPTFEKIGPAVYPSKEEMHNADCDVIPNSTTHCTTHFEEVCLCPLDMQDPTVQKDPAKHGVVPYTIEQDQSLIKSPLSFDTSSMFGDLTVATFDNSLYTDVSKEGFSTFSPKNDKRELFESSFSHLGHKDWNLMADDPPMLAADLSDKAVSKKFSSSHMHLTLSDKIMDDNPNFISNLPEDELEIKRIVTELETQLQTSKYSNSPLLANKLSKQLSRNNLSPLRLDHNAGNEQSCMPVEDEESRRLVASSPTTDPDLTLWSSPFQLGLLDGQQDLHTPVHADNSTPDHPCIKADAMPAASPAAEELQPQEMKGAEDIKDPATDKSEEMLENEMYTENLMKSLEVISDSIFNKGSLTTELEKPNVSQFIIPEQPSKECTDAGENQSEKEETSSGEHERPQCCAAVSGPEHVDTV